MYGRLATSTIVAAELYDWAYLRADPAPRLIQISELLTDVLLLDFDPACAERFGRVRAFLRRRGAVVAPMDLLIASVALAHDLTLVTHNTADFLSVPGLRLVDWLTP